MKLLGLFILSFLFTSCLFLSMEVLKEKSEKLDSLYISYTNKNDELLEVTIANNGSDTLYLFDSYLKDEIYHAPCLQRFNEPNQEYKVSYGPLIPLLGTRLTDTKILGANKVCNPYQVKYNFVKLCPNDMFVTELNLKRLFSKSLGQEVVYEDFYLKDQSKFDTNFTLRSYDYFKVPSFTDLVLEFAIYDNVDILLDEESFYLKEAEFEKQAKEFNLIKINVGSRYFKSLLAN